MRKIISTLVLASLLVLPLVAFTQTEDIPDIPLNDALDNITNFAFWFLMIVAVLFLIFAGITFVTAQGDPEKVKKARDYVMFALIGVVVGVLAKGLTTFLANIIQGKPY